MSGNLGDGAAREVSQEGKQNQNKNMKKKKKLLRQITRKKKNSFDVRQPL